MLCFHNVVIYIVLCNYLMKFKNGTALQYRQRPPQRDTNDVDSPTASYLFHPVLSLAEMWRHRVKPWTWNLSWYSVLFYTVTI